MGGDAVGQPQEGPQEGLMVACPVGDLDEAALFYLHTRGIPNQEARRMLIEAFVQEALELVDSPLMRGHLQSRITRRLAILEEQG